MLDKDRRELFSRFAARPTLALEVEARFFPGGFGLALSFVFPMLIHALEPKRDPAATGFEIGDFELGKFFQNPVGAHVQRGKHLFERMAGDMAAKLAVTISACLWQHRARPFVYADRDAKIRRHLVARKIIPD